MSEQKKTPSDLIREYAATEDGGELFAKFLEAHKVLHEGMKRILGGMYDDDEHI